MRQSINPRGAVSMYIVMVISTSVVLGYPSELGQDALIAIAGATVCACPLMWLYARLMALRPGENLYDMAISAFGKGAGRVVSLIFCAYSFILGALVLYSFAGFIHLTSLHQTPELVIGLLLVIPAVYLAKSGLNTLSRFNKVIAVMILIMLVALLVFSIPKMKLKNLLPLFEAETGDIILTTVKTVFMPFGETVILLTVFDGLSQKASPYKIFFWGLLIAGGFTLLTFIRSCSVLGAKTWASIFFPNYRTTALIELGDVIKRIESIVASVYILISIAKVGICLKSTVRGIAKGFGLSSSKGIAFPVGLGMLALSSILFTNMVEMYDFVNLYMYVVFPFHVLIPLMIWIVLEIKRKRSLSKASA